MESITFEDSGKLLRLADSLETTEVIVWLSVSGTVSKSALTAEQALQNLKTHYKEMLTAYPTLRLKLITKENLEYWNYATDEEIQFDNLIHIVDEPFDDAVPETRDADKAPLWRVHVAQYADKTKIKVLGSHCILDGRGIFSFFDLICTYALGRELNDTLKSYQNQPVLYEYGKKDWFIKEITEKKLDDPYEHFHLKNLKINPSISLPSHINNEQWNVSYPPMSKFCRKHGVTPQGVLMAIQNEAIRKFNKGKCDDMKIPVYIPIDYRHTKYATELVNKSLFFCHVGFILPFMENEPDMLENMKKCTQGLKEALNTTQYCDDAYYSCNLRNYETGEIHFSENYPNPYDLVFASHIGVVGYGLDDIQFRIRSLMEGDMYWATFYGFHNKETFSFVYNVPYNTPKEYFDSVKETSLKYHEFMVKDVSE